MGRRAAASEAAKCECGGKRLKFEALCGCPRGKEEQVDEEDVDDDSHGQREEDKSVD